MRRRGNSVLLACLLFALSGAALAYNIWTADSGDVAVSISDLVDQMRDGDIAVGGSRGRKLRSDRRNGRHGHDIGKRKLGNNATRAAPAGSQA